MNVSSFFFYVHCDKTTPGKQTDKQSRQHCGDICCNAGSSAFCCTCLVACTPSTLLQWPLLQTKSCWRGRARGVQTDVALKKKRCWWNCMKTRKSSRQSSGGFKHLLASVIVAGLFFFCQNWYGLCWWGSDVRGQARCSCKNTILYLASHSPCVAFSRAQAKLCTGCLELEHLQVASNNNFHKQEMTIMHYMIQNMNMEIHRIWWWSCKARNQANRGDDRPHIETCLLRN